MLSATRANVREHAAGPPDYPWGSRGRRFKSCRPDSVTVPAGHRPAGTALSIAKHECWIWNAATGTLNSAVLAVAGLPCLALLLARGPAGKTPWPTNWPPPCEGGRHGPCFGSRSTTSNGVSTCVGNIRPDRRKSYYFEMLDVDAIRDELLASPGPGGNRRYRTQIMDSSGHTPIDSGVHLGFTRLHPHRSGGRAAPRHGPRPGVDGLGGGGG